MFNIKMYQRVRHSAEQLSTSARVAELETELQIAGEHLAKVRQLNCADALFLCFLLLMIALY